MYTWNQRNSRYSLIMVHLINFSFSLYFYIWNCWIAILCMCHTHIHKHTSTHQYTIRSKYWRTKRGDTPRFTTSLNTHTHNRRHTHREERVRSSIRIYLDYFVCAYCVCVCTSEKYGCVQTRHSLPFRVLWLCLCAKATRRLRLVLKILLHHREERRVCAKILFYFKEDKRRIKGLLMCYTFTFIWCEIDVAKIAKYSTRPGVGGGCVKRDGLRKMSSGHADWALCVNYAKTLSNSDWPNRISSEFIIHHCRKFVKLNLNLLLNGEQKLFAFGGYASNNATLHWERISVRGTRPPGLPI